MPRLPKPRNLRQNRERRDFGLVALDGGLPEPPAAPAGLLTKTKADWAAFWSSPLVATVTPATDMPAIIRLFQLRDERDRMAKLLRAEPMLPGSKGQPVGNPLFPTYAALNAEVRQMEDRFGLTPMARLKLGVTFGDAARSLADINARYATPDENESEAADLLLTLAPDAVADARPGGRRVDGVNPRPRSRRRTG